MGDVILFGMHTMHASTTNLTSRFRLSCDVRFQPASEPADNRWVAGGPGHTVHGIKELVPMDKRGPSGGCLSLNRRIAHAPIFEYDTSNSLAA